MFSETVKPKPQTCMIRHYKESFVTSYHYDSNNEVETVITFVPLDSLDSFDLLRMKDEVGKQKRPIILDIIMSRTKKDMVRFLSICFDKNNLFIFDIPEKATQKPKELAKFLQNNSTEFLLCDGVSINDIHTLETQLNLEEKSIKTIEFFDYIYGYYRRNKKVFHKYFQPLLGREMFEQLFVEVNAKLDKVCSSLSENYIKQQILYKKASNYFDLIARQTNLDGIKVILNDITSTDAKLHILGEEIEYQEKLRIPKKRDIIILDIIKNLLCDYLKQCCLCNLKLKSPPWATSIHEYYTKTNEVRSMYSRDSVSAEEFEYAISYITKEDEKTGNQITTPSAKQNAETEKEKGKNEARNINEQGNNNNMKQPMFPWKNSTDANRFYCWLKFTLPRLGLNSLKYYYLSDIERIEDYITSTNKNITEFNNAFSRNGQRTRQQDLSSSKVYDEITDIIDEPPRSSILSASIAITDQIDTNAEADSYNSLTNTKEIKNSGSVFNSKGLHPGEKEAHVVSP